MPPHRPLAIDTCDRPADAHAVAAEVRRLLDAQDRHYDRWANQPSGVRWSGFEEVKPPRLQPEAELFALAERNVERAQAERATPDGQLRDTLTRLSNGTVALNALVEGLRSACSRSPVEGRQRSAAAAGEAVRQARVLLAQAEALAALQLAEAA